MSKGTNHAHDEDLDSDDFESKAPLLLDYALIPPEELALLVIEVTTYGGAIRFGYTRDGLSFCIGIYGDGDYYPVYIGLDDNWLEAFRDLRARFASRAHKVGNLRISR